MKVVLISKTDWANVGYEMQESLRAVGVEATSVQIKPHHFKYPSRSHTYKGVKEVATYARNADIIQFMHSVNTGLEFNAFNSGKGIVVFHGGSAYRNSPDKYNIFWNPKVQVTLIQTGDLVGIGNPPAKNSIWFLPPVNTDGLQPHYASQVPGIRVIGHCPSMTGRKGTDVFNKLMSKLAQDPQLQGKFVYKYTPKHKHWPQNIEEMKSCDIYFDACKTKMGNAAYGEWGIAALEACSLGKVVVSHFLKFEEYRRVFNIECPIQHANDFEHVERQIRRLILMPDVEFMALREWSRAWAVENHSRKVIGQKLVDIYNAHLTWEGK